MNLWSGPHIAPTVFTGGRADGGVDTVLNQLGLASGKRVVFPKMFLHDEATGHGYNEWDSVGTLYYLKFRKVA